MLRTACALVTVFGLFTAATAAGGADLSAPGPHDAGGGEVVVPRSGGGSFTATLYYPATAPGAGAPFDPSGGPYPVVSFGHGFLQPVGQYASTLQHLATWGYFAIAPQSHGGFLPDHAQFASDMSDCLTWLEAENADPVSPFHAQVDTDAFGLSGHSMGGGASILAAAGDARVRALASLAPAETSPSAIASMAGICIPVRLINGSEDSIVPAEMHGQPMYDSGSPPKQIQTIVGGFHCGFTDDTFPFCDSGSITRAEQLAITRQELTSFFNLCLKSDQAIWNEVWGPDAGGGGAVDLEADAGVLVTPPSAVLASPPGLVMTTMTVEHADDKMASYTLLIEGSGWGATANPSVTDVLASGASQVIEITVTVPAGTGGDEDVFLVTARSDNDDATRGFAELTVRRTLVGDLDGDGVVGFADLLLLLAAWGDCRPAACPADLDGDDIVGFADLLLLLAEWGG